MIFHFCHRLILGGKKGFCFLPVQIQPFRYPWSSLDPNPSQPPQTQESLGGFLQNAYAMNKGGQPRYRRNNPLVAYCAGARGGVECWAPYRRAISRLCVNVTLDRASNLCNLSIFATLFVGSVCQKNAQLFSNLESVESTIILFLSPTKLRPTLFRRFPHALFWTQAQTIAK